MTKFELFYGTKKGKIIIFSILGIVVAALIVGIIIGIATTNSSGASELTGLSISEIRERVAKKYIVTNFDGYNATGMLVFNSKLSYEAMKNPINNSHIVKYEISYTKKVSELTTGFIVTATCNEEATLNKDLLGLTEKYKDPIYMEKDKEKNIPVYVQTVLLDEKAKETSVTLCFLFNSQVFGVTTRVLNDSDIENAVKALSKTVNIIITDMSTEA
ncbi:MAG: hypothetical protein RR054_00455 [Clostridia bacterium]